MVQAKDSLIPAPKQGTVRTNTGIPPAGPQGSGRYHSHRVELDSNMGVGMPLELQHLKIQKEYTEVVQCMVAPSGWMEWAALLGMFVFGLGAAVSFVAMWVALGGDSGGAPLLVPGALLLAALACVAVRWFAKLTRIGDVRGKCRAVNNTLSSKKVQFSVVEEERSTGRTTTTDYFLVVKFFVPDTVVVHVPVPAARPAGAARANYGTAAVTPTAPPAPSAPPMRDIEVVVHA